jgi:hypothetical protein
VKHIQPRTVQRVLRIIALCFILMLFSVVSTLAFVSTTQAQTINHQNTAIPTTQYAIDIIPMNDSKAFLCIPLLGSCPTPTSTSSNPTPTPNTGSTPTPTATPTKAPTPTNTPTPVNTPTPIPTKTALPTAIPKATPITGVNQPVPGSTSTPSQSITSTVTATTKTPVATNTPVPTATSPTKTSTSKTAHNGQNQNTSSGMLLPIGIAGFTVLIAVGLLATLQIRRRQDQQKGALSPLAAQSSVQVHPWSSQGNPEGQFGPPAMDPEFANTILQPDAALPAMQDAMQQADYTYMADARAENLHTVAQPSPSMPDAIPQPSFADANIVPTPSSPSSPYATAPAQDAILSPSQVVPSLSPDLDAPPYMAPDMQPLTMNLPEDVINDLERKKTKTLPLQQEGLQDDPFLEAMMRQAQMGLFVLPDKEAQEAKETAESTPGGNPLQE